MTLAFAPASRSASISLINSIERSICSVVIALMPAECSTCISRGTNETSNFKNIAGLFFITLSMAFAPPRRKALCSSAMVSALSALRARSGLPPGFPEWKVPPTGGRQRVHTEKGAPCLPTLVLESRHPRFPLTVHYGISLRLLALFGFDACCLDDRRPARDLACDQSGKRLWAAL